MVSVVPKDEEDDDEEEFVEMDMGSLSDLVHALGSQSLGPDTSVQLHWPRGRSAALLQHEHDIVIVDTPGIDIEADFDVWIDNYCLDADLFVWVMNGESTLMMREKKFFRMVKEKIAKPNVLVVVNRWDLASEEEEYLIHAAHTQHMERTCEFLIGEMKLDPGLKDKIFFVSAKEIAEENEEDKDNNANMGGR